MILHLLESLFIVGLYDDGLSLQFFHVLVLIKLFSTYTVSRKNCLLDIPSDSFSSLSSRPHGPSVASCSKVCNKSVEMGQCKVKASEVREGILDMIKLGPHSSTCTRE